MKIYELLNKRTLQLKEKNIKFISKELRINKVEAEKVYVEWKRYYMASKIDENLQFIRRVRNIETGEIFVSLNQASESIGGKKGNISRACTIGVKASGYHWEYI